MCVCFQKVSRLTEKASDLVFPVSENLLARKWDGDELGVVAGATRHTLFLGQELGLDPDAPPAQLLQSTLSESESFFSLHRLGLNVRVRVSVNRGAVCFTRGIREWLTATTDERRDRIQADVRLSTSA